MSRYLGLLLAGAASAAACGDVTCLTGPNPNFEVEIRDAVTGTPSAFQSSLIIDGMGVYDSTYAGDPADSLTVNSAAPGVPGTYTVRVRRAGYSVWERRGVRLGSGCTNAPAVRLTVSLERLP